MRPAANLGIGPVESIRSNTSIPNDSEGVVGVKGCQQEVSQSHQLSLLEQPGPNQPKMD
eukprot:c768_g1_i1 orf=366-542(+)